jgi:hypothetical protein
MRLLQAVMLPWHHVMMMVMLHGLILTYLSVHQNNSEAVSLPQTYIISDHIICNLPDQQQRTRDQDRVN